MKRLLFFFGILVFAFSTLAQVKNEVFGVTLGRDNQQQVKAILESKGQVVYSGINEVHLSYVRYAGENWSKVQYDFLDNKVVSIVFSDIPSSSQGNQMFERVGNMLLQKYPNYIKTNAPGVVVISDDKITIELTYGNSSYIYLKYTLATDRPIGFDDL